MPLHNKHAHQRRTTASIGTSSVNSGTGFCCSTGVKELLTYVATASVQGYGKLSWVKRLQLKKHGRSSQHLIQTSYKKEPSTSKNECEEKRGEGIHRPSAPSHGSVQTFGPFRSSVVELSGFEVLKRGLLPHKSVGTASEAKVLRESASHHG